MRVAFFGSSLVSAYWNGAATYYRGIIREMALRGHHVTFYEPNAWDRQKHRDLADPEWAQILVYEPDQDSVLKAVSDARGADLIIKTSGVGVFDQLLDAAVLDLKRGHNMVVFWDVDAPATLDRITNHPDDPFRALIPQFDAIFTYGGGMPVVSAYDSFGAKACKPIYNALDTTTHYPVAPESRYQGDLAFLGNRLPDRETRVEEFFLLPAASLPDYQFVLGGSGWGDKPKSANVRYLDHVYTAEHNAFNCSAKAILNVSRESMARYGFSPATRVFEAAGAAACVITDYWEGVGQFFEPGTEILVARNGSEVGEYVRSLTWARAKQLGLAAYRRARAEHTYRHRAEQLAMFLGSSARELVHT